MARFPNLVQAALLFDRPNPVNLDTLIENFVASGAQIGVRYNRVETKPGVFYRLFGNNVMITVEYIGSPAKTQLFETALGTPFTRITNPDARTARPAPLPHSGFDHQGAMPPTPEITALLTKMNVAGVLERGQTLDHFRARLSLCGTLAVLAHGMGKASLVHRTTSDQLQTGEVFANSPRAACRACCTSTRCCSMATKSADGRDQISIKTFGANNFRRPGNPLSRGQSHSLAGIYWA